MRGQRSKQPVRGSLVALPTPFTGGKIDEIALRTEIERHVGARTRGIVVGGTTGEAATLAEEEKTALYISAVRAAAGRLTVVAGVGTQDTRSTLRLARAAERAGVDALLAVTPYYNRPTPAGLLAHFDALADSVQDTRIVLYNVPQRTGCDLKPMLVAELFERHANIVAIKEATLRLDRIAELCAIDGLDVLCGEDHMLLEFLRRGACGAVSVVGNVAPEETAELIGLAAFDSYTPRMGELEHELAPLIEALQLETNPAPLKAMLHEMTGFPEELRLPLVSVSAATRRLLVECLERRAAAVPA